MSYISELTPAFRSRSLHARGLSLLVLAVGLQAACGDDIAYNSYDSNYYTTADGGAREPGPGPGAGNTVGGDAAGLGGEPADAGAGGGPPDSGYPGAPVADTSVADHELDVFGTPANRYWFGVSEQQLETMNNGGQGGPIFDQFGDIYQPGGGNGATFVDHLWATTAGLDGKTADYGKVQVKIVGQSSRRPWDERSIPNLNIDADQFVKLQRLDGFEHLRFNNAQIGNIFRERLTLALYARLGYPAPQANYAWVSSNVWGEDISIPYVVVERYKQAFCRRYEAEFGGGCTNMWEFVGDLGYQGGPRGPGFPGGGGLFDDPENCQLDKCESSRVTELSQLVSDTPAGDGFKEALASYVDWDAFHRFQCLSWVLATGDDALHNTNNVVLVERADGLFQYLPYSVDISLGQDWYPQVSLPGTNSLARGCQSDKACWADTIAMCEDVIAEFAELDPNALLKSFYDQLSEEGMLRSGDEGRFAALDSWFTQRLEALPGELESNRELPVLCEWPHVDCGGYCDYPELCQDQCKPPVGPAAGPVMGGAGAAAVGGGAAGGAAGIGGGVGAGGQGPGPCPMIQNYEAGK